MENEKIEELEELAKSLAIRYSVGDIYGNKYDTPTEKLLDFVLQIRVQKKDTQFDFNQENINKILRLDRQLQDIFIKSKQEADSEICRLKEIMQRDNAIDSISVEFEMANIVFSQQDMYDENAINFMLERAATLILTDFRSSNNSVYTATVGINDSAENDSDRIIFHKISLIGLNILKSWMDFQKYVLNHLEKFITSSSNKSDNLPKSKNINWSQTFENIYNGNEKIIFKKTEKSVLDIDYFFLYQVFLEYHIHTEEVLKYFDRNKYPKNYEQIIAKLKEVDSILLEVNSWINKEHNPHQQIQSFIVKTKNEFNKLLSNTLEDSFEKSLFSYINSMSFEYEETIICNLQTQHALHWRENYLKFETKIGVGKDILITSTTDIPHLFELWCFCEFIFVLLQKRQNSISQYCYINPKRNIELLSISDGGQVYYNYMGHKTSGNATTSSHILKRTCVEWYIEYKGIKIVFDTKYKDWNSNDNLTVLGYMKDFQANVGIVIFSNNFDSNAYHSTKGNENIIYTERENEKFIALKLRPMPQYQEENHETLSLLISYLFEK